MAGAQSFRSARDQNSGFTAHNPPSVAVTAAQDVSRFGRLGAEVLGELGENGTGGAGAGAADPFDVGMGSFAFRTVEHGGDACRGQERRVGPVRHRGHDCAAPSRGDEHLDDGRGVRCLHRRAVQNRSRRDGEPRVGRSASFEQVSDISLDAFEGLPGKRPPFHGEHAAVRDGGLLDAAADQRRVQVARAEKRMRPAAELLVELVEGDEEVTGGEDGVGTEVRP
jgi:hypothetical protein